MVYKRGAASHLAQRKSQWPVGGKEVEKGGMDFCASTSTSTHRPWDEETRACWTMVMARRWRARRRKTHQRTSRTSN